MKKGWRIWKQASADINVPSVTRSRCRLSRQSRRLLSFLLHDARKETMGKTSPTMTFFFR